MYALLVIGALNTVISLVYYIKVLKVMALDKPVEELEGGTPPPLRVPWGAAFYSSLLAAAVFFFGVLPDWYPLADYSQLGVSHFVAEPSKAILEPPPGRLRTDR